MNVYVLVIYVLAAVLILHPEFALGMVGVYATIYWLAPPEWKRKHREAHK